MNLEPLRGNMFRQKQAQNQEQQKQTAKSFIFQAQEPKKFMRAIMRTKSHCSYLQQDDDFKIIQNREFNKQQSFLMAIFVDKTDQQADKIQIDVFADPKLNLVIRRNIQGIISNIVLEFKKLKQTKSGKIIKDVDQISLNLKSLRIKTLQQDQEKYQKQNYQNLEMYRRNSRIRIYNLHRENIYQQNIQKINQKQLTKVESEVKSIITTYKKDMFALK